MGNARSPVIPLEGFVQIALIAQQHGGKQRALPGKKPVNPPAQPFAEFDGSAHQAESGGPGYLNLVQGRAGAGPDALTPKIGREVKPVGIGLSLGQKDPRLNLYVLSVAQEI